MATENDDHDGRTQKNKHTNRIKSKVIRQHDRNY